MKDSFEPVTVLLVDVPDVDEWQSFSWQDMSEFPKKGYRSARVYLRYRGTPFAKLTVDLDDDGFPREPIPEALAGTALALANEDRLAEGSSILPLVTIVVATSGTRPDLLARCMKSLSLLRYPSFEIVLVDNRPEFGVGDSAEVWTDTSQPGFGTRTVTVVREKRRGLSFARNAGVLAATGEIIAFTDDDVEVDANWLSAMVDAFKKSPEVQCVTGLVIPAELETEAQQLFENFYGGFDRGLKRRSWVIPGRRTGSRGFLNRSMFLVSEDGSGEQLNAKSLYVIAGTCGVGANMAVRREFALRCPFDIGLGAGSLVNSGEDIRFYADVLWAGHRVAYAPRAIVQHTHRRNMDDLESQIKRMGMGQTAMLVSLITEDIRHVAGITMSGAPSALLRWVQSAFTGHSAAEGQDQERSYPPSLRRTELVGMALGPWRYLLSRKQVRSKAKRT
jgi:GT2 family glycosyltransferase